MRDSLQAMSLVSSRERIQGFGMFSFSRCVPDRWLGRRLAFHRPGHRHPEESGQLAQMLWRVQEIIAGRKPAARWAGERLPPHIAKNNNQLLSFNEKSCELGSVFPMA